MVNIPRKLFLVPLRYNAVWLVIIYKEAFFPDILKLNIVNNVLMAVAGMDAQITAFALSIRDDRHKVYSGKIRYFLSKISLSALVNYFRRQLGQLQYFVSAEHKRGRIIVEFSGKEKKHLPLS